MDPNLEDPGDPPPAGGSTAKVTSSTLSSQAEVRKVSDEPSDETSKLLMGHTKSSLEPSSPVILRSPLSAQGVTARAPSEQELGQPRDLQPASATAPSATMDASTEGFVPSTNQIPVEVGIGAPSPVNGAEGFSSVPNQSASTKSPPNAWIKPPRLNQSSDATTLLLQTTKDLIADLSKETQWPSLSTANTFSSKRRQTVTRRGNLTQAFPNVSNHTVGPTKKTQQASEDDPEYPWASKMEKSKRNPHKVTSPVFLEDGTPKVRIPRDVLLEGLENQREFVLGQFYRCLALAPGLIQSVVSRIWGTRCKIYTRQLGTNSFLFHIPDEPTRKWVTQRGIWHVDDCIMFVSTWDPKGTIAIPEITTIPVWLTLKDIPHQLYSKKGISWIASGIGAPMLTSKPWLDPILMGEAKILVEVKLDRPFPQKVALEDEDGQISMVSIIYSWLPSVCQKCGQLGHKAPRCLGLPPIPATTTSKNTPQQAGTSNQTQTVHFTSTAASPENHAMVQDSLSTVSTLPLGHKDDQDNISTDPQGCIPLDQERSDFEAPIKALGTTTQTVTHSDMGKIVVSSDPVESDKGTAPTKDNNSGTHLSSSTLMAVGNCPIGTLENTLQIEETNLAGSLQTCEETIGSIHVIPSTTCFEPTSEHVASLPIRSPTTDSLSPANRFAVLDREDDTDSHESLTRASKQSTTIEQTTSGTIENSSSLTMLTESSKRLSDIVASLDVLPQVNSHSHIFTHETSSFYENDIECEDTPSRMTRGGRPLKPTLKLQEMEWAVVGKSNRGRRGRGRGNNNKMN